ncbi:MutS-related protein [Thermomonospora umbrina]|uniref:MutS-like protein n=1 Tax=Thermomonospora umbrina TaxID=111806 RepID=A0A3D9ST20_9ACTN|nr:DNA mismatch repair protein MutS [Thermomonospora umbrina]REE97630.1 MutS-like protein [Thermomonospora umbrina]
MRPGLLFADDGVRPEAAVTGEAAEDLHLDGLWAAMARGDERLFALARAATLAPLTDPAAIAYRQDVLDDCLRNAPAVRALYALADEAVTAEQKILRGARPEALLNRSVRILDLFCDHLRRLGGLVAEHADAFRSDGFTRLFRAVRTELDVDYLRTVETMLEQLRFEHGIVVTARLGKGNKGVGFTMHEPPGKGRDPSLRRFKRSGLGFTVPGDPEDYWRALSAFRGRVLEEIATATAQSADHVRDFFVALRDEVGFYVGCVNLAETLSRLGLPTCRPEPTAPDARALTAEGLYEPCLALLLDAPVVANDVDADRRDLVMVTGTNRGGKSTFLRSVGVAHLMMQSGMFVGARRFAASIAEGLFTHFKREEDRSMSSGKLDEELARMSAVVDRLRPGALVLCNESFVSTNEREGSDIAAEILRALTDVGVRVVFVTHLYDLAHRMHTERSSRCLFLTAGGDFRLAPGTPSPTAHAMDLYERVLRRPPLS